MTANGDEVLRRELRRMLDETTVPVGAAEARSRGAAGPGPRSSRNLGMLVGSAALVVALVATVAVLGPGRNSGGRSSKLATNVPCGLALQPVPVLALTRSGDLDALDPSSLSVEATLAGPVRPDLGVAVRPELDLAYVTGTGPDGGPALYGISLTDCRAGPVLVEADAELPSVSPDGGFLGYVTLDARGRQSGVAVVPLDGDGMPTGPVRDYPAASTPPPLPVTGLAVGRQDAGLAVWGGFVDSYLGSTRPTVGTLDPATATSLTALTAAFDGEGISVFPTTTIPGGTTTAPGNWQTAPLYLPAGELLVGTQGENIEMPFTDPNGSGGGIMGIVTDTGPVVSVAAGPGGSVAFVGTDGRLTEAVDVVDLPFGPGISGIPPAPAPTEVTTAGPFTAVAWTEGAAAKDTPLPAVYPAMVTVPNLVGLTEPAAAAEMATLGRPVYVARTVVDGTVPVGTVVAQDPAAGDGICQCTVNLTVATGGPAPPTTTAPAAPCPTEWNQLNGTPPLNPAPARPGLAGTEVPDSPDPPDTVTVCRYAGSNQSVPVGTLETSHVVTGSDLTGFVTAMDGLPVPAPGPYYCPADWDAVDLLIFGYASGPTVTASVDTGGCAPATNGSRTVFAGAVETTLQGWVGKDQE